MSLYNSFLDFIQGMVNKGPHQLKVNQHFTAEGIVNEYKSLLKIVQKIPPLDEPETARKIAQSIVYLEEFLTWASDYDFHDHRTGHTITANGFWSIPLMAIKLCEGGIRFPHLAPYAIPVIHLLVDGFPIIRRFREEATSTALHSNSTSLLIDLMHLYMDSPEFVIAMSGPICAFHVCDSERFTRDAYMTIVGLHISQNFFEGLRCLFSKKFRGQLMAKFCRSFDVKFTKQVLGVGDFEPFRTMLLTMATFFRRLTVKNIYVSYKAKYSIAFTSDGKVEVACAEKSSKRSKEVRVKYLRSGQPNANKNLLFAFHGGGFVCQSPETHEYYTRGWATAMPGVPILSVDYAHAPENKFPVALNDILDVYLWLTSKANRSEVEKQVGFVPERIVLFGDSAGGNNAMSLLMILNDIRRNSTDFDDLEDFVMPLGIVTCYACFSVRPMFSPSNFMTSCDPFLSPMVLLNLLDAYAPTRNLIKDSNANEVLTWSSGHTSGEDASKFSWTAFLKWFVPFTTREKREAWFACPKEEFQERLTKFENVLEHPYMSPVMYDQFESLQDISLGLVTPHFDPLHDDSIEMAKRWKGPLTVDCVNSLSHGFLHFVQFSGEARAAGELTLSRIQRIFDNDIS